MMRIPSLSQTMRTHLGVAIVSVLLAILALSASAGEKAMIHDAWVREAPPNMMMHAAYFTLMNPGGRDIHLIDVESKQYVKAEMHLSKTENGVATMSRQEQLTIPAGGSLVLKPGSFHVMLMKPISRISRGDEIDLSLIFADGATTEIKATVKKGPPAETHSHRHHKLN